MKRAGAGVGSANRITLLRDADGDGMAETRSVFLQGLNSPFGMALVGDELYVANTDAIVQFPYTGGADQHHRDGREGHRPARRADQPSLDQEHHRQPGRQEAVRHGGLQQQRRRERHRQPKKAARRSGRSTWPAGRKRVFATRPPQSQRLAWEPQTGALWTVVNERDEIGNDLVPDYLTSVKDGAFYGWPYSYYGQHVDERVKPQRPGPGGQGGGAGLRAGRARGGAGLTFSDGRRLPEPVANGVFIGEHGSWNRKPPSGYKVVFVPFANGKPSRQADRRADRLRE